MPALVRLPPLLPTMALLNCSAVVAEVTSTVPPPAFKVAPRSVLAEPPVYCRSPPLKVRFAAALDAAPIGLATPPLVMVATLSTPPFTAVTPV